MYLRWTLLFATTVAAILIPFFLFGESIEAWAHATLNTASGRWLVAAAVGGLLAFDIFLPVPSSLVSTAGSSTYPVFVLGAIKSTIKPSVGVAAVVLFAMTIAALAFVAVVLRRSGDSSSQIAATMTGS